MNEDALELFVSCIAALSLSYVGGDAMNDLLPMSGFTPPKGIKGRRWINVFKRGKGGRCIGLLESLLSLAALWFKTPVILGAWLVFKATTKWAAWNHIVKVPENFGGNDSEHDPLDYLRARNEVASRLLDRFLVGTMLNILAGAIGWYIGQAFLQSKQ